LIERALGSELTHHLGYPPGGTKPDETTNHRNGTSGKTVLTDDGPVAIEVPRDRQGTFEPRLIGKPERRFTGFDDKVLALYARGMTVREIQAFLAEMSSVAVSPDLISTVTEGIVAEVTAWQTRPLEPMYPVVFFDALRVKIRDEATVVSKVVYLALAILPDGTRDILGLWIEHSEGAKFWMKVFTDLKTRGCQDILIAVTDAAGSALEAFERSRWGARFPTVVAAWRRAWTHVIPFFAFAPEIRRVIYTTNALESVHARLRKIIKTRGHFPNDEAATKLLWLALRNLTRRWTMPVRPWREAMTQFAVLYQERFVVRPT
jgi:putative transposase